MFQLFLSYLPVAYSLNSQLGKILDACIWPPRILGPLSDRHGVPTPLYGSFNNWDLKARET